MTGIIVTGHGTFPEGILSAVSLVAGKPDNTEAVNFEMGQSSEDLKDSMAKAMESLEGDEVLILAAALLSAGREGLRDLDALDSEEEAPEFEDGL